ncbi:unnamed protein product [Choristocarpus tenellus]
MKAAIANAYGDIDQMLSVSPEWPRPELKHGSGEMLIRVQACSISPADLHLLSGRVDLVMSPPSFPYVPGMDVCGIVEEIDENEKKFKDQTLLVQVGDCVVASNGAMPVGGLAEFAVVKTANAEVKPSNISILEGAALVDAGTCAMLAVKAAGVKEGDRALVLGGSGGIGTVLVQLVRDAGASFIASTSTDDALLKSLGVDQVINYREQNWWEVPEFQANPFDVIIDCIGIDASNVWKRSKSKVALKSRWNGGRFVTLAITDTPVAHSMWQAMQLFVPALWKQTWTFFVPWMPRYKFLVLMAKPGDLSRALNLVDAGRLKPVLDPSSPFPFTTEGVKSAFHLLESKHAHGKVVIEM